MKTKLCILSILIIMMGATSYASSIETPSLNAKYFADIFAEIQTTIDDSCPNNGCDVYVEPGRYNISTRITFTNLTNNIHLIAIGEVIFQMDSIVEEAIVGTVSFTNSVNVTANVDSGAISIDVSDASDYSPGDLVKISSNETDVDETYKGENIIIRNITSNTIEFKERILYDYNTDDTARLEKVNGAKNIRISGFIINGTNETGNLEVGIRMRGVNGLEIDRNEIMNTGNIGIWTDNSYDVTVHDNTIHGIYGADHGYAIQVYYGSKHYEQYGNLIYDVDEGFDCGSTNAAVWGWPSFISIHDEDISNVREIGIDNHEACHRMTVKNNKISGSAGNGLNVAGEDSVFSNNDLWDIDGIGIAISGGINQTTVRDNILTNIKSTGGAEGAIYVGGGEDIVIDGNLIRNFKGIGIWGNRNVTNITIIDNILISGPTGIQFTEDTFNLTIGRNVMKEVTTEYSGVPEDNIGLNTSADLIVSGDTYLDKTEIDSGNQTLDVNSSGTFIDTTNNNDYGIRIYSNNGVTQDWPLLNIIADNTAFDRNIIQLQHDGTQFGFRIDSITLAASRGGIYSSVGGASNQNAFAAKFEDTVSGSDKSYAEIGKNSVDTEGSHWFFRNLASTITAGPVVFIEQDNESDDQPTLTLQNDGTGPPLRIAANTTNVVCSAANEGGIYFDTAANKHYGCDGTNWNALY